MTDEGAQEPLLGLARLNAARGQLPEAVKFQTQASEIAERFVGFNLAMGSEREKLALLDTLSWSSSRNMSFHVNLSPDNPAARELAINTILRQKGAYRMRCPPHSSDCGPGSDRKTRSCSIS